MQDWSSWRYASAGKPNLAVFVAANSYSLSDWTLHDSDGRHYICYEAYHRFLNPPDILGGPMLAVVAAGFVVNLVSMKLLSAGSSTSLNVKGAYFEVLSASSARSGS